MGQLQFVQYNLYYIVFEQLQLLFALALKLRHAKQDKPFMSPLTLGE